MEHQLKKGDNFVRFSKYGGKIFGVVSDIFHTTHISDDCDLYKLTVLSTNGVCYDYNECHKSTPKFNEQQIQERKKLVKGLEILTERKHEVIREKINSIK